MYRFWSFIADNILSLLSVAIGVIVLVLQGLGLASTDTVASATLALVALIATSEVVERQRRLSKLEKSIEQSIEQYRAGFDRYAVKQMPAPEAHEYVKFKVATSKKSIYWVSVGPRRSTPSSAKRPYEDALEQVALAGRVEEFGIWFPTLDSEPRIKRAQKLIFAKGGIANAFVKHISDSGELPYLSFLIIDDEEVIVRPPLTEGGRIYNIAITSSTITNLFLDYFDRLWEKGITLDKSEKTRQYLDQLATHAPNVSGIKFNSTRFRLITALGRPLGLRWVDDREHSRSSIS